MKKVLITGATGMIGNIVLQHCLASEAVQTVVSLVRKPSGALHPKLTEIAHRDFLNYDGLEAAFTGVDAAYFCIGVYTGAVPDAQFREITVDYTKIFADKLKTHSPGAVFCFLSGAGADPLEKSRTPFARYKGMAENYLIGKGFGALAIFRPGYIYPVEKRAEPNVAYRIFRLLYPLLKNIMGPNASIRSTDLGAAMFKAGLTPPDKTILENRDIIHHYLP
jgi:uncharacterized protein YbjT (DUF2867 family)